MTENQNTETAPTNTKYTPKGIPLYEIIDSIENHNLSITETAKRLGVTKSTVSVRLKEAGYRPGYLQKFKSNRADIFAAYQQMLLRGLTPKALKTASVSQIMTGIAILYDKERLERGQSTENIEYADVAKSKEIVDSRIAKFEEKYGILRDDET